MLNITVTNTSGPGWFAAWKVGEPYPGLECRISPEGEIQVKSAGTMLGYYKADDLTAEVMTEDGFLKVAERVMPRREVAFTPERRASLAATYRRLLSGP